MSDGLAYCLRCRKKVKMENPVNKTMKNGRKAISAKCSICHGGVYKILPGAGSASKSKSTKSKSKKKSKKGGKSRSKKASKSKSKRKSRSKSRRKSKKA
jgi:mono/diheme cytochrome c family protein